MRALKVSMQGLCLLVLITQSGCGKSDPSVALKRTVKVSNTLVTFPEQGWSDADAEWFYNVSQGSQLMPYDWIEALMTRDGKQNFAATIPRFGYIERSASKDNPLGLPVGFVKDDGKPGPWLGLNCSACHTLVIEYGSSSYLVDGAPTLADAQGFLTAFADALLATSSSDERFNQFAKDVLKRDDSPKKRATLRTELEVVAQLRKDYNDRNMPKADATQFGCGRIDAIGAIMNEVSFRFLEEPMNHKVANAPVSYPFLWDVPHHDKVQWNGSAPNTVFDLGNLARNVGEVLGVFGFIDVPVTAPAVGYASTIEFSNLRKIEAKLKLLKSPLWPSAIERSSDVKTLASGKAHFDRLCAQCHSFSKGDRNDNDRKIVASMTDVGTDKWMAENFRLRKVNTGRLKDSKINFNPLGGEFEDQADGQTVLVHVIIGAIAGSWKGDPDQLEKLKTQALELKAAENDNKYKGRPLNGIWATAPYLHNGSVPTLRDVLKPQTCRPEDELNPQACRPKVFWVGSRRFNPKDVGFESQESSGGFKFDTSLQGNSNSGHEYGTGVSKEKGGDGELLKPEELDELLEYLKTL